MTESYYNELGRQDVVSYFKQQLQQGGFKLRDSDGKLTADLYIAHETPWRHVKHAHLDCHLWHKVMFDVILSRLGEPAVPSKCQNCWKVVVRPSTLKGLFALEKIQIAMDVPSKCGIEIRKTVHGLYGGYFYNYSFAEGLERYRQVRKAVDEHPDLGPEITVLLKRACTEFEHLAGDSKFWKVTPRQIELEQMVERYVAVDDVQRAQPEHLVRHVHRKWIEYAYTNGDPTYLEYTNGEPLYPPYRTYHHLADATEGEIQDFWLEVVKGEKQREQVTSEGYDIAI